MTLTITVNFESGIQMEENLNKAIDELGNVLKKKGIMDMTLEGKGFDNLNNLYCVEIKTTDQ